MRILKNVMCPNRQQIGLATDIYLPDAEGAYPLVLMRTPYGKSTVTGDLLYDPTRYTDSGFAVAIQDCRGTGASEGRMDLNGRNDRDDGYDAVEWLAVQPFCNGRVGMFGLSYFGFTQLAAASGLPPHLNAICPFMTCSLHTFGASRMQALAGMHLGWAYGQLLEHPEQYMPDDAFRSKMLPILQENRGKLDEYARVLPMNQNPAAMLPGVPLLDNYLELVEGVESKAFWDSIHSPIDYDHVHAAMLHGTGWMDMARNSTIDNYMAARQSSDALTRSSARLLIGPWTHGSLLPDEVEGEHYGPNSSGVGQDVVGMMIRWFNLHLKDMADDCFTGRVRYFVMGANEWHTAADWPPPESVPTRYYLTADHALQTTLPAAGQLPLVYDPADPAPSTVIGPDGHMLTADWSAVSSRADVLEFQTAPLETPLTLAGVIRVTLHAAADVPDTDFSCRLTDVAPDGSQRQLTSGLVRARHRNGMFRSDFLTPGEIVCYEFGIGHAAYQFQPGHRIGIQLAGSDFPASNRNLNTTEPPALGSTWAVAHDQIFCGGSTASYIELPIL